MTAKPNNHAKSTSARDLRYGRRGGRWAHLETDAEQAQRFADALASGAVVYVRCRCLRWWVAARDVGLPCHSCLAPMTRIGAAA